MRQCNGSRSVGQCRAVAGVLEVCQSTVVIQPSTPNFVIPAIAGIQPLRCIQDSQRESQPTQRYANRWIPAFAGMTTFGGVGVAILPICRYPCTLITQRCCPQYFRHPCASHHPTLPVGFFSDIPAKAGTQRFIASLRKANSSPCFAARSGPCPTRGEEKEAAPLPANVSRIGERRKRKGKSDAQKKRAAFATRFLHWMVEMAGIEPASEGTPSPVLHA